MVAAKLATLRPSPSLFILKDVSQLQLNSTRKHVFFAGLTFLDIVIWRCQQQGYMVQKRRIIIFGLDEIEDMI